MSQTLIVFDVGSTLIHPDFLVLSGWVTEKTNVPVKAEVVERAFRHAIAGDPFSVNDHASQADAFWTHCGYACSDRALWGAWWEEIVHAGGATSWLYTSLDIDAKATLECLKACGFRLAAASNSDGTLSAELASFGLEEFFEATYDSVDLGSEKPAAEFYTHVLHSSDAATCVHIGDDLIKDFIGPLASGFQHAILYDPADVYVGLPSHVKVTRLSEIGRLFCDCDVLRS